MTAFDSINDVLDFAIKEEEQAFQFYTELAQKMTKPGMKQAFEEFAQEEKRHKQKLLEIKEGKRFMPGPEKVLDLKIADYLVDIVPKANMEYQEALVLAMKKEKAAYRLYNDLALQTDDLQIRNSLLALAQEEAKHKLRFEIEYDNLIE